MDASNTSTIDKDGFRQNVGIILSNRDKQVFWGKRVGKGGWQFPQGGIAPGESPESALYRELREEVGLDPEHVTLLGRTRKWLRYRLPSQYRRPHDRPLCIGQKQVWFLLRLEQGDDALHLETTGSPEFQDWRWVDYWQPPQEVIFFKRRVYERALEELAPLLFSSCE